MEREVPCSCPLCGASSSMPSAQCPMCEADLSQYWPIHFRPYVFHNRAVDRIEAADLPGALAWAAAAVDLAPRSVELHLLHARLLGSLGDLDAAIAAGEAALDLDPRNPETNELIVTLYRSARERTQSATGGGEK